MLGESSPLGLPSQQGAAQLPSEATWVYVRGYSAAEAIKATWRGCIKRCEMLQEPRGSGELSGLQACPNTCSAYPGRQQETHRLNSS